MRGTAIANDDARLGAEPPEEAGGTDGEARRAPREPGLLGPEDPVSVLRLADPRCSLLGVSGPNERPLDWVARLGRFGDQEKRMCLAEVGTEAYWPGVVLHPVTQRQAFPEAGLGVDAGGA